MTACIKDLEIKGGRSPKLMDNLLGNNLPRFLMGTIQTLMHTNLMYVMTLIVVVNHHHMHMNPLLNIALHYTHKPYTTNHLHIILTHIHRTNHHMNHL